MERPGFDEEAIRLSDRLGADDPGNPDGARRLTILGSRPVRIGPDDGPLVRSRPLCPMAYIPTVEGAPQRLRRSVEAQTRLRIGLRPPKKKDIEPLIDERKNEVTIPVSDAEPPRSPVRRRRRPR